MVLALGSALHASAAYAQLADSTTLGAGTLSTSGVWDPNNAATELSNTLTTVYNESTSVVNAANSANSTANSASSAAQSAASSASTAHTSTSSGVGVASIARGGCGILVITYLNGSTETYNYAGCEDR